MSEFLHNDLKYLYSVDGMDIYAVLDPDSPDPQAAQFLSKHVFIRSDSENAQALREAHKIPGTTVAVRTRENFEGLCEILDVDIKPATVNFGEYEDPETHEIIQVKYTQDLANAHAAYFDSLSRDVACSGMASLLAQEKMAEEMRRLREENGNSLTRKLYKRNSGPLKSDNDVLKREVNFHMRGSIRAAKEAANTNIIESYKALFAQFNRRPEFSKIPRDLFPVYCLLARPAIAKDKEGKDYQLPSMFQNDEEEAKFMRIIHDFSRKSEKDIQKTKDRLASEIPNLPKETIETIVNSLRSCTPSSLIHLQSLYDSQTLLSKSEGVKDIWKNLGEIPSIIERMYESGGSIPLTSIISRELRGVLAESFQNNKQLSLASLPQPVEIGMKGAKYELIAPDPKYPDKYMAIGPIIDMPEGESVGKKFMELRAAARSSDPNHIVDYMSILATAASHYKVNMSPMEFNDHEIIKFGEFEYRYGDNGKLYEYDRNAVAMTFDNFVKSYLQPPKFKKEDYGYDEDRLIELARASVNVDRSADACKISKDGETIVFFQSDRKYYSAGAFSEFTMEEFNFNPAPAESEWERRVLPNIKLSNEEVEKIKAFCAGDKKALNELFIQGDVPARDKSYTDKDYENVIASNLLHARAETSKAEYVKSAKEQAFINLFNDVANESGCVDQSDSRKSIASPDDSNPGRFRIVDGKLYSAIKDQDPRLINMHHALLEEARGMFGVPENESKHFDGEWHEGDVQKMPTQAREILHTLRHRLRERLGPEVSALIDHNWFELVKDCSSHYADELNSLTKADMPCYANAAVNLFVSRKADERRESLDANFEDVEYSIEELISDPRLTFDGPVQRDSMFNQNNVDIKKQLYLNSFIDVLAAKNGSSVLMQYGNMLTAKDWKDRLQMPDLTMFSSADDESTADLCMQNAELTKNGERVLNNSAKRGIRDLLKAMAFIRNNKQELPSGDIPDMRLVEGILERLPLGKEPSECTVAEMLQAAELYNNEKLRTNKFNLLKQDREVFKAKAREIDKIRRERLEKDLTKYFTAPGRVMARVAAALENI